LSATSKPTASTAPAALPSAAATATPKKEPKFAFKPLKAALILTPNAISRLKEMLNQPDPKLVRVGVKNRGCAGLAYHLEYVDKAGKFDEVVEQDGQIPVLLSVFPNGPFPFPSLFLGPLFPVSSVSLCPVRLAFPSFIPCFPASVFLC
jgi:hypothetical protein